MDYTAYINADNAAQAGNGGDYAAKSQELPYYQYATDLHNYGQGSFAITDPDSWGQGLSNAGKFIVGAAVSGASSIYNSGVAVANYFGADAEEVNVASALSEVDSDLGLYYQANKENIDLVGFIGTSLVPGLGGVKILNAGTKYLNAATKTGFVGNTLGKATGLMKPVDEYIVQAGKQIASQSTAIKTLNSDTIKAIGAGFGKAAMESAAFELAVVGTMFKSPVLEDQDAWDIAKNMTTGVVLGGAIGGALNIPGTLGKIKKFVAGVDEQEKAFSYIPAYPYASSSEKIILMAEDMAGIASKVPEGEFADRFARSQSKTLEKMNNLIFSELSTLTKGDLGVADAMSRALKTMDLRAVYSVLLNAEEMGKIGTKLDAEKLLVAAEKKIVASGAREVMEETGAATLNKSVAYFRLGGEGAGDMRFDAPKVYNIADTQLPKGEDVYSFARKQGFKEKTLWDPRALLNVPAAHITAEARYIWAENFAKVTDGMKIHELDIPLLEKAIASKVNNIVVVSDRMGEYVVPTLDDLVKHTERSKLDLANYLMAGRKAGTGMEIEEIAKFTNVRESYLNGQVSGVKQRDLYARKSFQEEYTQRAIANGTWTEAKGLIDTNVIPSWTKIAYNNEPLQDLNGFVVQGMTGIRASQKITQEAVERAFANEVPEEIASRFVELADDDILKTNRYGAGPGIASFSNGNYGTIESKLQQIGATTAALRKHLKDQVIERMSSVGQKLVADVDAAIEFEAINQKIASTAEHYVYSAADGGMIPRSLAKYRADIAAGKQNVPAPQIQEGAPSLIPIKNSTTLEAIQAHIEVNGKRVESYRNLRAAQGKEVSWDSGTFYPIRPNPRDYKHIAFVVDEKVTGAGHVKMIHARDAATLEKMVAAVPGEFRVYSKPETLEFKKLRGEYDHDRALTETYIDASLKRAGVNSQFFQKTDPQKIAQDLIEHHTRAADTQARELVSAKYERQFVELRRMGEQFDNLERSHYGSTVNALEDSVSNPYLSYLKVALDISQVSDYPLLVGFNNLLDSAWTKFSTTLNEVFASVKGVDELDKVHSALEKAGVKSAYYDAATTLLANHSAPRNELGRFVRTANSIISSISLRLDPSNAINNMVGNVLLVGETRSLINAIKSKNAESAGDLAKLMDIQVPGTEDFIPSTQKLLGEALKNFVGQERKELIAEYKANGWISDLTTQYRDMIDDLTLQGGETASALNKKMSAAWEKARAIRDAGEKATGNKFAEELNRFVAADVARQITDLGVKHGIITAKDSKAYISTFVNRTQGNVLASQRPLMFQGPVGQAIGLFQTYQFNLLQQMFRHVGEGRAKDAGFILGLQGTVYGLNGLPAFNYINTHIVGTASGNQEHKDIYSSVYGIAGKTAGDWLLYGAASNVLGANLYTRGDINPRQLTVVPVNPADIPLVSVTGRILSNLKDTVSKIQGGGDAWQSILQGLEHNGMSRPLAGFAQVGQALTSDQSQVFSTSSRGNIVYSNDLMSLSSLWRLAGSRPLDESIVNDATFRITAYTAADREKMMKLSQAIKTQGIGKPTTGGAELAEDEIIRFAEKYVELGGNQKNFNKWMLKQLQNANNARANQMIESLKDPYAKQLQLIMGGRDVDGNFGGDPLGVPPAVSGGLGLGL